jgi:16S rRNA (adenine1518-N6/adenine1519-N6)-dimethyltransferase
MNERSHRRKLGQNYLIDPVILFEIERAINPQKNNIFFEIGPGMGALTRSLIGEDIKILAMDLDEENINTLQANFYHNNHKFIHGDILHESLDFLSESAHRVVGNLPYNISTQIILKLILHSPNIVDMHFLVQKEVAHRVCSSPGNKDWGRLALKIGAFFQSTALFNVPPEAFDIKPKVQSTFMRLIPRKDPQISLSQYPAFSALVDMAFANKRKNIKNNLKSMSIDLVQLNINQLARAEELSLDEFVAMFKASLL